MYKNNSKEINFSVSKDNLVISDNLGYVYSLNKKWKNKLGKKL